MSWKDLLIVAGEASGDLHGARLVTALRQRVPELSPFGFGGEALRQAGLAAVSEESIAVVGITEVLKVLPRARAIFRQILDAVDQRRPTTAVLVDFPEFNLRLAKALKERGVEVIYYISPQVWAWRRYRVRGIAKVVDLMLVLFPFEVEFYRRHHIDVRLVGHPLVDEVSVQKHLWDQAPEAEGAPRQGPYHIALLPGSRRSEVEKLLPLMLQSVAAMAEKVPLFVRLIQAPTIPDEALQEAVDLAQIPVRIVREERLQALADSHLALCASGTATLETGLVGTPMIVMYRLTRGSYWLARLLVRLPHFSLVNLVLGRGVVPELLQGAAHPQAVADRAVALLQDTAAVAEMRQGLHQLRGRLGRSGATERAAAAVAERLGQTREHQASGGVAG
jgi:lipid-A-disaccharide synthase